MTIAELRVLICISSEEQSRTSSSAAYGGCVDGSERGKSLSSHTMVFYGKITSVSVHQVR